MLGHAEIVRVEFKKCLLDLLNELAGVYENSPEIGDTAVRERLFEIINKHFINRIPTEEIIEIGMFSKDAEEKISHALQVFFKCSAEITKNMPKEEKLQLFQDENVTTEEGWIYDDFFGHRDDLSAWK